MPDPSTALAVVDHAGVSVADLERSERFWREVLGFEMVEDRFAFPEHDLRGVVLVNVQGARVELFERKGFAVAERQDLVVRGVAIHNYRMVKALGLTAPYLTWPRGP